MTTRGRLVSLVAAAAWLAPESSAIGLNGKPGPRPDAHMPRSPDGTYDLPEGR